MLTNESVVNGWRKSQIVVYDSEKENRIFWHVMTHTQWVAESNNGEIVEGTKARGRQRKMYLDDICTWTNQKKKNVIIRKYKDGEIITWPPTSPGDGTIHEITVHNMIYHC